MENFEKTIKDSYGIVYDIILPEIINDLVQKDIISAKRLEDKIYVLEKVLEHIDKYNIYYENAIDHREELLKNAEKSYSTDYELSITLYAIFIEHTINSIIDLFCRNNSIGDKSRIEIIRNVNIIGKFTWLLEVFKIPNINSKILKSIKRITEARNSYVHYKWNYTNIEIEEEEEKQKIQLEEIKSVIKYIKTYESKYKYNGLKHKIKRI